ncbi:MAG: DUF4129 domain-containing protein [Candidatus Phosphoribacter sp.]
MIEALVRQTLPADLDPSGPQARQWVADELATDGYHDGRPLLGRILEWLGEKFLELSGGGGSVDGQGAPPILVAVVAALAIVALALLLSRVRTERRTVTDSESVLGDLSLTPTQFRDRGAAALRERRWDDAVIDYTRAVAREAADRTLLTEAPSLTAHEVGAQLAVVFPGHATETARAMDTFDRVRYGRYAATEDDARAAGALDDTLRKARPELRSAAESSHSSMVGTSGGPG